MRGEPIRSWVRNVVKVVPYRSPPLWQGLSLAVLCVVAGALLRFAADPVVQDHLPIALFYPFVLAAAVWGGTIPAFCTVLLALILSNYFWFPPEGGSFKFDASAKILMVAFSLFCGFAILMIALFRILLEAHVEGEERAVLLAHEMKHRSSNLLGMVQAISAQTARNASSFAEYQCLFTSRLAALAQAQQLFAENPGSPPDLRQFLQSIIEPFDAARFQIVGPDVTVPPYLGTCCALLFHELATNATKYGALSSPDGVVIIKWDTQKSRVRLEWQERNGPPVVAPTRAGFGSRLLKTAFPPQYGEAAILFNANGVCCTVSFVLRD